MLTPATDMNVSSGRIRPPECSAGPSAYHPAVADGVMDRETAHAFAHERCLKETTYRHLISVEGVMRALARRFDEDPNLWGFTGLFHDLDQDHTGDDGAQHARLAAEWLREAGVDERVVNGVLAHAYEEFRTDLMSRAVVHADAVAGLLVAAALVRPERSAGMKVSSVKKKIKERSFAPGVNREEVNDVEASLGLPLDEFLAVSIEGLQEVATEIDL
jgi:putative nucleotidyltransferase with HDIG domain